MRVISVLAVRSRRVDEKLEDSRELRPLILNYYHPPAPLGLNPEKEIRCRCVVNRVLLGVHFRSSIFGIIAVSQSKKINKTG